MFKELKNTTQQEVFDKVASHLLTQNKKSVGAYGACKYRGDNGMMCAVGCLIGDDEYSSTWEGMAIRDIMSDFKISRKIISLLEELQHIHDFIKVAEWFSELHNVATIRNLDTKVLNKHNRGRI